MDRIFFSYKNYIAYIFLTGDSMKFPVLFFCIFLLYAWCNGQSDSVSYKVSRNALYIEGGGWGGKVSLNYERNIIMGKVIRFGGRVGIEPYFNLYPVGLNFSLGDEKNHFEIGIGQTFQFGNNKNGQMILSYSVTTLSAGYKYQPRMGGVFFRIAFTPLFGDNSNSDLLDNPYPYFKKWSPWIGLSLGYSFKKKQKILNN